MSKYDRKREKIDVEVIDFAISADIVEDKRYKPSIKYDGKKYMKIVFDYKGDIYHIKMPLEQVIKVPKEVIEDRKKGIK
jgi:hypothetical protein